MISLTAVLLLTGAVPAVGSGAGCAGLARIAVLRPGIMPGPAAVGLTGLAQRRGPPRGGGRGKPPAGLEGLFGGGTGPQQGAGLPFPQRGSGASQSSGFPFPVPGAAQGPSGALSAGSAGAEAQAEGLQSVPSDPLAFLEEEDLPLLIRHADTVSVISSQTGRERRLYYWNKQAVLALGDEVRQGPGAISELIYQDNAIIRLLGANRVRPRSAADGTRSLEFFDLARSILDLRDVVTRVYLPGGTWFEGADAQVVLGRRDAKAIELKNSGPGTLDLFGLPRQAGVTALQAGYKIYLPNLPLLDRGPVGELHSELLSGLRVLTGEGIEVAATAVGLLVSGTGPGPSVADVGGARVIVGEGSRLHFARPRREPFPGSLDSTSGSDR